MYGDRKLWIFLHTYRVTRPHHFQLAPLQRQHNRGQKGARHQVQQRRLTRLHEGEGDECDDQAKAIGWRQKTNIT